MSGLAPSGGTRKRRSPVRRDLARLGSRFYRPKSSSGSGPGKLLAAGSNPQAGQGTSSTHPPRSKTSGRQRSAKAQSSAQIGPTRGARHGEAGTGRQAWGGEGGSDAGFDLDRPARTAAGEAPARNARTRNRALYIPWGRNRSSLSRLGQFEQPRQQTSSTATPTVTRLATRLPFIENQ